MNKKIIIPETWMGESIVGAMDSALNSANASPVTQTEEPRTATP